MPNIRFTLVFLAVFVCLQPALVLAEKKPQSNTPRNAPLHTLPTTQPNALTTPAAPIQTQLESGSHLNIPYTQSNLERQLFDIHIPQAPAASQTNTTSKTLYPTVFLIHGGGWSSGHKGERITIANQTLLEAGFVVVSVNYRLAPEYRWPACLDDVTLAWRYIRDNAQSLQIDINRMAVLGYSAGGHIAGMFTNHLSQNQCPNAVILWAGATDLVHDSLRRGQVSPSLKHLFNVDGLDSDSSGLDGPDLDVLETMYQVSPINHLRPGLPPHLFIHGTQDRTVPFTQSEHYRDRLHSYGIQAQIIPIEGGPHNVFDWETYHPQFAYEMANWLKQVLKPNN